MPIMNDLGAWSEMGTRDATVLNELRALADFYRKARRLSVVGTTGKMPESALDGISVVEQARTKALAEIERDITAGKLDESLTPADYAYALSLLYQPASLFAASAERETAAYLQMLSGGKLLDLTEAKGVNEDGPDGLFVGGIPALRIAHWMGLEVKTAVSTGSLNSNLSVMLKRLCQKAHKTHSMSCVPKIDRHQWRQKSLELALKSLTALGRADHAAKLADAGKWGFRTVLVVRATSLDDIKVPANVRGFFDLVIPFDLFGRPIYDPSMRPTKEDGQQLAASYDPYDDLYEFAGMFNNQKARALLKEFRS